MKIISNEKHIKPNFTKINLVTFEEQDKIKKWEYIENVNSVHILVYNKDSNKFLFTKQFRPPVFMNQKEHNGFVIECCAGLVDKDLPLLGIASEEVLEELGYDCISIEHLEDQLSSVGLIGQKMSIFVAIVDNNSKVNEGGGIGSENIEVIEVHYDEVYQLRGMDLITSYIVRTYYDEMH